MNMKQLRYFVCIAEAGSLSKASKILNNAQTALSQKLASREQELGVE